MVINFKLNLDKDSQNILSKIAADKGLPLKEFILEYLSDKIDRLAHPKKRKIRNPVIPYETKKTLKALNNYYLGRCRRGTADEIVGQLMREIERNS